MYHLPGGKVSKVENVVYLGLGGNIGDSLSVLQHTLSLLTDLPDIQAVEASSFYVTTPVSDIPQADYLNAVCRFKTSLNIRQLLVLLQEIEKSQGKVSKPTNAPRIIDIDILFFGTESHSAPDLEIPHPRWHERLFVVIPLLDLAKTIAIPANGHGVQIVDLIKLKDSLLSKTAVQDNKEKICIKYL
ncbi:MAG TPA: 2-amino-4-hydroxy-6-hydroxymethyldihydropteridine diphosphokinase [Parachlamydiaceae bacterium]|nr:2-amino-4-hydroxy-6-hydroxymethyldihydropteridine diphosphokinase [Parachlamydiaceae bacterium]